MTFDEKLAQALRNTAEERAERMLSVTKKHRFSLAYRLWKKKTLSNLRKNRLDHPYTLPKARITVAIMTALILFAVMACTVVGTGNGRLSFVDKKKYSNLYVSSAGNDKTYFEEYYGLPEETGWECVYFSARETYTIVEYKRGDKGVIFQQELINTGHGNINTENAVIEPMSLYEENDGYFIKMQNGSCMLLWLYDGYLLEMRGKIDKNELLDLAYSTKIVDF